MDERTAERWLDQHPPSELDNQDFERDFPTYQDDAWN